MVGLRIDSEYTCRPRFTKLEQGSKAAVTLRALIPVSHILKLSSMLYLIGQHEFLLGRPKKVDYSHQTVFRAGSM